MHVPSHSRQATWVVKVAILVTALLVMVEFMAGVLGHSLALISDGWHKLSDVPALIFSWLALHLEQRPPDQRKTFGYQRAGVLAAFVNGLILVGVALFICYEGYERIVRPEPVASRAMLWVGALALVINGGVSLGLAGQRRDLNLRSVLVHSLGDALSSVGIIAGGWLIGMTGVHLIDPLLAFLIAGMILWSSFNILTESSNILLESLPQGMSLEKVASTMLGVPGVREVHDVHIWSLGSSSYALSCHVQILDMPTSESELVAHHIRQALESEFGIAHTTLQFEHTHLPGDFHMYMPEAVPPSERKS